MTDAPSKVSGNIPDEMMDQLYDLAAEANAELDPELADWVEQSEHWGKMLRHPLVYMVPLTLPGMANQMLRQKRVALAEAIEENDWHSVVFLHEKPHRLNALLSVTGSDEYGDPIPLVSVPEHWNLAADVWVDSENIHQNTEDWRALIQNGDNGLWLGSEEEREAYNQLPRLRGGFIRAWRGGAVGDWSWTTSQTTAQFFSRRSGLPVRGHLIPTDHVFGYLTRRGESELLVKYTDYRARLVYPNGDPLVSGNGDSDG